MLVHSSLRFSNFQIRTCMEGKELYLLVLLVGPIRDCVWSHPAVLHCVWMLAICCSGCWDVRRVSCWLWFTWH